MKKVIATKLGFYDNSLRNPGDHFEVTDETPLGSWLKMDSKDADIYPEVQPRSFRDPDPVNDPTVGNTQDTLDIQVKKGAGKHGRG